MTQLHGTNYTNEVVADDRPCPKCKYNLRGLPIGGACPECGSPVLVPSSNAPGAKKRRTEIPIDEAPKSYLMTLQTGLSLLGLCGMASILLVVLMFFNSFAAWIEPVASIALGLFWLVGLLMTMKPRPRPAELQGQPEWRELRWATLGAHGISLALSGLAIALAFVDVTLSTWTQIGSDVFWLVGTGTLAIYVSFLTDWASDTSLSDRLRACVWFVSGGGLAFILSLLAINLNVPLFSGISWFIMVFAAMAFIGSLVFLQLLWLQAASIMGWARNAKTAMEREVRRTERRRKQEQEQLARAQAVPAPAHRDDVILDQFEANQREAETRGPVGPQGPMPGQMHTVNPERHDQDDEADIYKLED